MLRTKFVTAILLVSILALSTGCDSYATKKAAAKLRWEKTTAKAKVPAARGLFENGMELARTCRARLEEVEQRVTQLLQTENGEEEAAAEEPE